MVCGAARSGADYPLSIKSLSNPKGALRVAGGKVGNDRFTRDRGLSLGDERPYALGQVDVHARAEADHADALAGADARALAHETDDSARDQPRDLHHADARLVAGDDEAIALVVLARLVEVGVEENTMVIDHALDLARERAAVHVTVEHAHEDRYAWQRPLAQPQLLRRHRVDDAAHPSVGGSHQDPVADRRHPHRVAEEIDAPERRQRGEPTERRP